MKIIIKQEKTLNFLLINLCFLSAILISRSQSIQTLNVNFRLIDDKIEIFYDLPENQDSIFIEVVFLKESNPEFKYYPKFIEGNIGLGIYSGMKNIVTWYYKKEPPYLFTGDGFYFEILAKKTQKIIDSDSIPD
jgi:hypothetical protein